MGRRIPVLKLPYWMRSVLSIPQGRLFIKSKDLIKEKDLCFKIDSCIGDVVCSEFSSSVKIVDGRTRRSIEVGGFKRYSKIVNPRSTISLFSKTFLSTIRKPMNVFVDGEEDLLVIALGLNDSLNNIVYGQPGAGVVVVDLNYYSRLKFIKILKTFKPDMSGYPS